MLPHEPRPSNRRRRSPVSALLLAAIALTFAAAFLPAVPQAAASAENATITYRIEGYDEALPTLIAGEDFDLGKPVGADPAFQVEADGPTPLASLVEERQSHGLSLVWRDQNGSEFDWLTTPVVASMQIDGTFEARPWQVNLTFGDDAGTPDVHVEVPDGQSFVQAGGVVPSDPVRVGYAFQGWFDDETGQRFDFDAPVHSSAALTARYRLADATVAPTFDPAADVAQRLEGVCWIGATWDVHPAKFSVSGFSGELEGLAGTGTCSLPSAAAPSNTSATYVATLNRIDIEAGLVIYDVTITPPGVARPDGPRNRLGLIGYQTVAFTAQVQKSFGGRLALTKVSADEGLTADNACYSLAGAVYGICNAKGERVGELVTGEDGSTGESGLLPVGVYSLVEERAPMGYALGAPIEATVEAGKTTQVNASDAPQHNPVELLIRKHDAETDSPHPLGAATLEGAEFTMAFHGAHHATPDEARSCSDVLRTWTFRTDARGVVKLDESHFVSGDPLFRNAAGDIVLPLGSVTVFESAAPTGYLPTSQSFLVPITATGTAERIESYQAPTVAEQVKRGDLRFSKASGPNMKRLANVPFKLTSETTGESHVLVTDENGMADTSASWNPHTRDTNAGSADSGIWFGVAAKDESTQTPQDETAAPDAQPDDSLGALPYDTYLLEEQRCESNEGLELINIRISITRDAVDLDLGTIDDEIAPYALIGKIDATTAAQVEGAELLLERWDAQKQSWVEHAHTVTGTDQWRVPVTPGSYRLTETLAPDDYLQAEPVTFEVLENLTVTQVEMVDEPIVPEEPAPDRETPDILPKTGDGFAAMMLITLAGASTALIVVMAKRRSR